LLENKELELPLFKELDEDPLNEPNELRLELELNFEPEEEDEELELSPVKDI
jgi:hypothetical protein